MGVFGEPIATLGLTLLGQTVTPAPEPVVAARKLALALLGILLIAVVVTTGFLLLRSFQRTRQRMMQRRPEQTEWVDAWSLHRLPREEEPQPRDEGDGGDEDDDSEQERPD